MIRRICVTSSVVMQIESDLQSAQEGPAPDKEYVLVDLCVTRKEEIICK